MDQKEKLGLQSASKYFYLNQGGSFEIESKYDHEDFIALLRAMDVLGFSSEDKLIIFKILASILHLGNICFKKKSGKSADLAPNLKPQGKARESFMKQSGDADVAVELASTAEIKWVAYLLGLSECGLSKVLTFKTTATCSEKVYSPYNIEQALDTRDAIAKALYASLFSWLVGRVNSVIGEDQSQISISILDIFGFENFGRNSFEQLCINFANETLQLFFNKHVFKEEQEAYKTERISWSVIGFKDNQAVIDTISKKPLGILHLLDDESNFPKGTDFSFLEKCHYHHGSKMCYTKPKMSHSEFVITHYAGDVAYDVHDFLEKNRNSFQNDVVSLLMSSKHKLIPKIFGGQGNCSFSQQPHFDSHFRMSRLQNIRPRISTVGAKFHDSLSQLMENMSACHPWFVRCIKPNHDKIPLKFDMRIVLQQLRSTGMLETIRIRKLGYPVSYLFSAFTREYGCLKPQDAALTEREGCEGILNNLCKEYQEHYQVGASCVFMRANLESHLERLKLRVLETSVLTLQKNVRRYLVKKRFKIIQNSVMKIQSFFRGKRQRALYLSQRNAAVRIQRCWRKRLQLQKNLMLAMQAAERETNLWVIQSRLPDEVKQLMKEYQLHSQEIDIGVSSTNTAPMLTIETIDLSAADISDSEEEWQSMVTLPSSHLAEEAKNLLLLFTRGDFLTDQERYILGNHIANLGMQSTEMKSEIYTQLCKIAQERKSGDMVYERIWQLLSICLSSFAPLPDHARKILGCCEKDGTSPIAKMCRKKFFQRDVHKTKLLTRLSALTHLEWRSVSSNAFMALTIICADGKRFNVEVESWSTAEDVTQSVMKCRGIELNDQFGWTIALETEEKTIEINGNGYIFDLISCVEYPNSEMFEDCNRNCIPTNGRGGQKNIILAAESQNQTGSAQDNNTVPESEMMSEVSAFLDRVFDEALSLPLLDDEDDAEAIARSIKGNSEPISAKSRKTAKADIPSNSVHFDPVNQAYRQQLQNVYYNQLMQIMQLHSLQSSTLQNVQQNVFGQAVSKALGKSDVEESPILPDMDSLGMDAKSMERLSDTDK